MPSQPIHIQPVPNNEVLDDYARNEERMTEGVIGAKTYPVRYEYDDVDALSSVALFARFPWLDTVTSYQDRFCDRYRTNGPLPGGVGIRVLQKFAWRSYFSCADGDLIIGHGRPLQQQRESFTKTLMISLSKYFRSPIKIPERFEMELFWYRTRGKMELARNLMNVTDEEIEAWRVPENGDAELRDHAYVLNHPQIRVESRYHLRTSWYWTEKVQQERSCRSMIQYTVPYQALSTYSVCEAKNLMEAPNSGRWQVFYVAQLMHIAAGVIKDLFDTYRLLDLSPRCIRWLRQLDGSLVNALGNRQNAYEFLRLFDVIKLITFYVQLWR